MAWELKAVEEQRMLLIEQYASGEYTVTELSERFCISRKTVYKWIKRHEQGEGLNDRSRQPQDPDWYPMLDNDFNDKHDLTIEKIISLCFSSIDPDCYLSMGQIRVLFL